MSFNEESQEYIIDTEHLDKQRAWSAETFGPGLRTRGVIDHIKKELVEIEADPTDVKEWIDVAILALDGAWRSGARSEDVLKALHEKQEANYKRSWPDWREFSEDEAIEHVRLAGGYE